MAIATITPNFTVLSTCDATTGWNTATLETEFYKQGSASLSGILRTVGLNARQYTWSGNLTNTHLRLWFSYAAPGAINTKALGGIRLHVVSNTGTGYWYLGGADTYDGGWTLLTVDTSKPFDAGTSNLSAVTAVGFTLNLVSAPRNATNTWWDFLIHGSGYTATGGTAIDPITLNDIYTADNNLGYGVVRKINSVYFVSSALTIGAASGTTNTYFKDENQIVVFEDQPVNAALYKLEAASATTNTTSIHLKDVVIRSANTATRFNLNLNNINLNSLFFDGNVVINANQTNFKSGQVITNSTWNNCNKIITNGAGFTGNTITNTSDPLGGILWANDTSIQYCKFINNSKAVQINTTGEHNFVGLEFDNNIVDINNTSGGNLVINVSGGDAVLSYQPAGTVTIQASATLTLTGIIAGSEVRIYQAGTQNELFGIEEKSTDPAFSYTSPQAVDIVVHNIYYNYWRMNNFMLPAYDSSLPISQVPDRNYNNPD